MRYRGIVLTGTPGNGKSKIVELLSAKDPRFGHVRAVTTRKPRPDDTNGHYTFLEASEFTAFKKAEKFLID